MITKRTRDLAIFGNMIIWLIVMGLIVYELIKLRMT